ncbi:MAG: YfiT family bacillithiol transferase [Saprospiraceae bacterium]
MIDPRYPIGQWKKPEGITFEMIQSWVKDISELPGIIKSLTSDLSDTDLQKTYRADSWTIKQLIHHLADSHLNAYIRHKLCITTDQPTINPYNEAEWAQLADVKLVPISTSLQLLEALHLRWFSFLFSLSEMDMQRAFFHPQQNRLILMEESIGMYSWHGRHHTEHIRNALKG